MCYCCEKDGITKILFERFAEKTAGITRPLKRFFIQYLPPIRHSVPFSVENRMDEPPSNYTRRNVPDVASLE